MYLWLLCEFREGHWHNVKYELIHKTVYKSSNFGITQFRWISAKQSSMHVTADQMLWIC